MSVLASSLSFGQKKYEMVVEKTDGTSSVFNTEEVTRTYFRERKVDETPVDVPAEAIDLGLPSGTKWASYNVGASKPEEYGGYYAWGETEEKDVYKLSTYKYYQNGSWVSLDSDISGTEYDVAHVKWGGNWVMPTVGDIKELLDNCRSEWTTLNGVNGRRFTGSNGGTIFMPAAGYRWYGDLVNAGSYGHYRSSTSGGSYNVYELRFDSGGADWHYGDYRFYGHGVRPVVRN